MTRIDSCLLVPGVRGHEGWQRLLLPFKGHDIGELRAGNISYTVTLASDSILKLGLTICRRVRWEFTWLAP
jgi:hypothetical protein